MKKKFVNLSVFLANECYNQFEENHKTLLKVFAQVDTNVPRALVHNGVMFGTITPQ